MGFEGLTEKVGPLPAIAWAGMAGVGFVVFRYVRNKQTAKAAAPATVGVDPSLSADSGPIGDQFGAPPLPGSPGISGIGTNTQWSTLASTNLINSGRWTASEVETALWGYMNGQALTGNGPAIISAALAQFGSPPEGNVAVLGGTPTTSGSTARPAFQSNADWASYAEGVTTQEMTQQPKDYSVVQMTQAVYKYLNGQPLNNVETRIVNHVLVLGGPPPVPVAPPGATAHLTV